MSTTRIPLPEPLIDAESASRIANAYLIDNVGDLLEAGVPQLSGSSRWDIPIILGNVRQGRLGEVGTIGVDVQSGEVLFTQEARTEVEKRAELLVRTRQRS